MISSLGGHGILPVRELAEAGATSLYSLSLDVCVSAKAGSAGTLSRYNCAVPVDSSLEQIVHELRAGRDRDANFRLLFLRFQPQVFRFFVRKGVHQEDARELTQEVFFAVHRGIVSLESESQFMGWLFTIARNSFSHYIDRLHTLKRKHVEMSSQAAGSATESFDLEHIASSSPDMLTDLIEQEKLARLRAALAELPDQMRRCVHLRVVAEHSYQEISILLGISINTVKAHLHKARHALGEKLRQDFGDMQI